MREWLAKPLVLVAVVVLLLGALSAYWLYSTPRSAGAGQTFNSTAHQRQLDRAMRETASGI